MIKKLLLLVLLLLSNSYLIGKTLILLDNENKPIVDIEIIILSQEIESIKTDNNGKIELKDKWITNNQVKILILGDNYEAIEQDVEVIEEETIFSPKAKPKGVRRLQNVVVRNKGKLRGSLTIDSKEMKKYLQIGINNDVASVVKNLPGVSYYGDETAELFIQGGSNAEWVSLYDHMWILNATRFRGSFTAFNPLLIETLEFYTAGYPASIGQGLSGILWLETLRPSKEDWKFYVALDKAIEFMAHGPLGENARMLINVRRTMFDNLKGLFYFQPKPKEGQVQEIPILYGDGLFKIFIDLTENDKLQYTFNFGYELLRDIANPQASQQIGIQGRNNSTSDQRSGSSLDFAPDQFLVDLNILTSLKYIRYFGDNNILTTTVSMTPRISEHREEYKTAKQNTTNKLESFPYQMTLDFTSQGFDDHQITTGLNFYQYQAKVTGTNEHKYFNDDLEKIVQKNEIKDEYTRFILGSYVMDDWSITDSLVLQGGIRMDYYEQRNQVAIQPRGGITYDITEEVLVFTRGGYYTSNNPNARDLDNIYDTKETSMEKAVHSISGIEYGYGRWFLLTEGFYKYYWDLRSIDAELKYTNNKEKHAYGGDVYLIAKERPDSIVDMFISYTLVIAYEKIKARKKNVNRFVNFLIPEVGEWYRSDDLRHHTLTTFLRIYPFRPILNWWYFVRNTSISGTLSYTSGLPRTKEITTIADRDKFYEDYPEAREDSFYDDKSDFVSRGISKFGKYNGGNWPYKIDMTFKIEQKVTSWFSWHAGIIEILYEPPFSESEDLQEAQGVIVEYLTSGWNMKGFLVGLKFNF